MQTDATLLANNTQHCWAQQCCDLLRPFARIHNNIGSCCVRFNLKLLANKSQHFYYSVTGEAYRNNVAPVCMEPWPRENVCARAL